MAWSPKIIDRDRASLLRVLASCAECGVLCLAWRVRETPVFELMDLTEWNELVARDVLGDRQVDGQGVGVNRGWFHVCPPTRAELVDLGPAKRARSAEARRRANGLGLREASKRAHGIGGRANPPPIQR